MDRIKKIKDKMGICTSCGKNEKLKNMTIMSYDTSFCPRCYSAFRLYDAAEKGFKVDEDEILAIFEGRKHVDDVLVSRGMKSERRN